MNNNFEERKARLRRELEAMEKVEGILSDPEIRKILVDELRKDLAPNPTVNPVFSTDDRQQIKKSVNNSRAGYKQGMRRAILLSLHTGSATARDIARFIVQSESRLIPSLRPAVNAGYVSESNGMYSLTELGREAVAYFQENADRISLVNWSEWRENRKSPDGKQPAKALQSHFGIGHFGAAH